MTHGPRRQRADKRDRNHEHLRLRPMRGRFVPNSRAAGQRHSRSRALPRETRRSPYNARSTAPSDASIACAPSNGNAVKTDPGHWPFDNARAASVVCAADRLSTPAAVPVVGGYGCGGDSRAERFEDDLGEACLAQSRLPGTRPRFARWCCVHRQATPRPWTSTRSCTRRRSGGFALQSTISQCSPSTSAVCVTRTRPAGLPFTVTSQKNVFPRPAGTVGGHRTRVGFLIWAAMDR